MEKKKVILIGLDGLQPELIERYKNKIPKLESLLSKSFYSEALPSILTDTPTNWTTIATGSYMGTHGITGFFAHLPGMKLGEVTETFNSNLCCSEYLWETLEKQGKVPILINYPISFPIKVKKGIVIGGDGLTSDTWTVRWPDIISTDLDVIKNKTYGLKESSSDKELIKRQWRDQNLIKLKMKKPENWKNVKNGSVVLYESIAYFNESGEEFEWGAAGRKAKIKSETSNIKKSKNHYHVLTFKENSKIKVAMSKSKDLKKAIFILEKDKWSKWVDENYNGEECKRKYKILHLNDDGSEVIVYGTMATRLNGWGYPPGIEKEISKNCGHYIEGLEMSPNLRIKDDWYGMKTALEILEIQAESLGNIASYTSKEIDWDLMMMHYHVPDGVSHIFLRDLESSEKEVREYAELIFFNSVKIIFNFVDSIIRKCADSNTLVCIVSDHGNIPMKYYINSHKIMIEEGLTKFRKNEDDNTWDLDFKNSKAVYSCWQSGFWINLKGRQKYGTVCKGSEYEKIRDSIINRFSKIKDLKTGMPIFELIGRKEAFESMGIHGDRVPDVLAFARPYYLFLEGSCYNVSNAIYDIYNNSDELIPLEDVIKAGLAYDTFAVHWGLPNATAGYTSNKAILMLNGPGIEIKNSKKNINLVDIASTITSFLGIKPPLHNEGRFISEAFK